MHDDPPEKRAPATKAPPAAPLSEAELSRIAREAVHQPADARLDKQLARMGLMDAADPAAALPAEPLSRASAIDPELVRLRAQLRRMRVLTSLLIAAIAILVIVVVVLLAR